MRKILILCSLALIFTGCFSAFQPDLKQRVAKACGDPMNYPLSDECIAEFGKYGSLMRRKSDLVVAAQKACTPSDLQLHSCETAMDRQPSCRAIESTEVGGKGENPGDPNYDSDMKQCAGAVGNQCGFVFAAGVENGRPEDFDPSCKEAKSDLKNFMADLQRAEMQRAFAPSPRVVSQPVFIRQAPPRNTTCMPFGTGVTCNSW